MKKKLIIVILLLLCINSFSQIKFESGYFIDNSGKKTTCLIKNVDWRSNPTSFEYKLNANDISKTASIQNVSEFSITNTVKYKRFTVEIDRSSSNISQSQNKTFEPEFETETLFLKYLVVGDYNLLSYVDKGLRRFFYNNNDSTPIQLVYRIYDLDTKYNTNRELYLSSSSTFVTGENQTYKKQLWEILKCNDIDLNLIQKVDYNTKSLIKVFNTYNKCKNPDYEIIKPQKKDLFNLNLRPGISLSSLNLESDLTNSDVDFGIDFGNNLNFRFGIEAEFIFAFNKNKWSVFVEPTFERYTSTRNASIEVSPILTVESDVTADYTSIDLPLGIRHYFFLNDYSKLFIDAALVISFPINSSIDTEQEAGNVLQDFDIDGAANPALGIGYKFKKYSIQLRYGFDRRLAETLSTFVNFDSVSFILGYSIF